MGDFWRTYALRARGCPHGFQGAGPGHNHERNTIGRAKCRGRPFWANSSLSRMSRSLQFKQSQESMVLRYRNKNSDRRTADIY